MTRLRRYDYACPFVFRDDAPSRTVGSAYRTPEGYLQLDGYLARSGLLEYSDGLETWTEYRSKAELRAAADSWLRTPVTDEHPDDMVDASNWTQLAKGHLLQSITVETLADGEDYLRATVLVTDLALAEKIESRKGPRELSIGFSAAIVPKPEGYAEDGTRCDAVQLQLEGNHVAVVAQGRAGPSARLIMDGAAFLAMNPRFDKQTKIVGPDGQGESVPSWLAKVYAEATQPPQAAAAAAASQPAAAPQSAPAVGTLTVDGESFQLPQAMVDQIEAFLGTPEGRAALDSQRTKVADHHDWQRRNLEELKRAGYSDSDLDRLAQPTYADYTRARRLKDLERQTRDSAPEVDERTAEFMQRNGY